MDMDVGMCTKRNIHNRTEEDLADIVKNWEETPRHHLRVDVRSLLQSVAITEVSTVVAHALSTLENNYIVMIFVIHVFHKILILGSGSPHWG
jgi:hypothetical protein